MTNLVKFAENKDAIGFKGALHALIAEKVTVVLDALREKVAEDLFNEGSEEARAARAKRMKQKEKGKKEE